MKAAARLALLAALPAYASETVTPAQARSNVAAALPPDIARGAGQGDPRAYLERLSPEQKQAALRSLTAKEGEPGAGLATGDRPGARFAPAAAGRQGPLNVLEQRIERAFRRGQRSAEFQDTMQDARGLSVAELKAAGITFKSAEPGQKDAVLITPQVGGFTVSLRDDALASGGDTEARAAAHVANGVRQAQTLRDHEVIGWALVKARGWLSGARTHKELAPNDVEARPVAPSDKNLMAARKLLDQKTDQFNPDRESYGTNEDKFLPVMNSLSRAYSLDRLFERFMVDTQRAGGP